jgi:F-type H+-transporting ATPase subunit a
MESIGRVSKNLSNRGREYVRTHPRVAWIAGAVLVWMIFEILIRLLIPVPPPHVSLSGEPIFSTGPSWFTNSLLTTIIVDVIVIGLALLARSGMSLVPSGFYNLMEAAIEYLYGLAQSVAGKDARKYFPWAVTIFLFVIISNWSGLIPGVGSIGYFHAEGHEAEGDHAYVLSDQLAMADGQLILRATPAEEEGHAKFVPLFRAPSADLNMTFALAISTMIMVQVWGVQALGGSYFRKFWNTSGEGMFKGINIFVSILELISEISRILAFGFRLFGNIFAGEIMLATMAFLVALLLPIPFYMLEIFVGFVQALVFMMLTLAFASMATVSHGGEGHGGEHHHEPAHAEQASH